MNYILHFVLCCILAFAGGAHAVSEQPTSVGMEHIQQRNIKDDIATSQAITVPQVTASAPLFVQIIPAAERASDAEYKEYEQHEKPRLDRWLTGSTVALAVFTFLLFIYTACLWRSTSKLVRKTDENSQIQLRAYVNIASVNAQWLEEPDNVTIKMIKVTLDFANTGQTPAYNVTAWMIARSAPPDTQQFEPNGVGRSIDSVGVLGHGQFNHVTVEKQVEVAEGVLNSWKNGTESLFVFGLINYTDVFNAPHVTEFRLMMPCEGVGVGIGKFRVCREGNKST